MMPRSATEATSRRDGLPGHPDEPLGDHLPADPAVPVRAAVPVLLDGDHRVQAERGAAVARRQSVLGHQPDAGALQQAALRDTTIPIWLSTRCWFAVLATASRWSPRCWPPMRSSGCASAARRSVGSPIFLAYLVPPVDPVHPAGASCCIPRASQHPLGADLHLSDLPDPVLHLAADGLLQVHPVRAGGVRADRRRHALGRSWSRSSCRWPCPGLISAGIFAFTLSWNEFIYALTFVSVGRTRRCRWPWSRNWSRAMSTTGGR